MYRYSCLSYSDDETTPLIVIVVTTVGSSVVLFVSIVTLSIFIRRRRKRLLREQEPSQEYTANPLTKKRDTLDNSSRKNFLHSLSVDGGSYRGNECIAGCDDGPLEGSGDQIDYIDSLPCDSYNLRQLPAAEVYLTTVDEEYTNAVGMGSKKSSDEGGTDPGW